MAYRQSLAEIPGIRFLQDLPGVVHNYAYFPVLIDPNEFGLDRDAVYRLLKRFNVNTRKYFHPLISDTPAYSALPSADPSALPVAHRVSRQILCLPIHGTLDPCVPKAIAEILAALRKSVM
jgi:dTDP-4-amino-4,6-dideoxygalactose transaminase